MSNTTTTNYEQLPQYPADEPTAIATTDGKAKLPLVTDEEAGVTAVAAPPAYAPPAHLLRHSSPQKAEKKRATCLGCIGLKTGVISLISFALVTRVLMAAFTGFLLFADPRTHPLHPHGNHHGHGHHGGNHHGGHGNHHGSGHGLHHQPGADVYAPADPSDMRHLYILELVLFVATTLTAAFTAAGLYAVVAGKPALYRAYVWMQGFLTTLAVVGRVAGCAMAMGGGCAAGAVVDVLVQIYFLHVYVRYAKVQRAERAELSE
ncbi:hypothetical protein H9P43_005161 [Blastocladiella emersonii ATCC 22665]|nr:hypothetical protein H9P43_005161 [Blastocladiella emersonii ATCC 22665]